MTNHFLNPRQLSWVNFLSRCVRNQVEATKNRTISPPYPTQNPRRYSLQLAPKNQKNSFHPSFSFFSLSIRSTALPLSKLADSLNNMKTIFTSLLLLFSGMTFAQSSVPVTNSPICIGSTLQLSFAGNIGDTYQWTGPGGFTSTLQNPQIVAATAADAGVYTLVVNGTDHYTTVPVIVNPSVTLAAFAESHTIIAGSSVQLNASGAEFYYWTPDDRTLSNPNLNNPLASPFTTTNYKVVGMNRFGCRDSAFIQIDVQAADTIYIPKAFTPNNDGNNDIFRLVNFGAYTLQDFSVQNRWGQQVYHNSYDIHQGWDGTWNGVAQDMGTYSYSVVVAAPSGEKRLLRGSVSLIR